MKRETREWLRKFDSPFWDEFAKGHAADALATDTEVKQLRAVIRKVLARLSDESMEAEDYSPVDELRAALKPLVTRERKRR